MYPIDCALNGSSCFWFLTGADRAPAQEDCIRDSDEEGGQGRYPGVHVRGDP